MIPAGPDWAPNIVLLQQQIDSLQYRLETVEGAIKPTTNSPSLRDEVESLIDASGQRRTVDTTDAVLAVVRRHVEALPTWHFAGDELALRRNDVLRMLGATDD